MKKFLLGQPSKLGKKPALQNQNVEHALMIHHENVGGLRIKVMQALHRDLDPAYEQNESRPYSSNHVGIIPVVFPQRRNDSQKGKKNPASQVFRENAVAFRLMAGEFGLTPSSRSRLDVEPEEQENLALELFKLVND